jgi:hypothetical protein
VFFVINRCDECDEEEIADGIEHNRKMLSAAEIPVETLHRLSAKRAMQGDVAGSGLPELAMEIATFLGEQKGQVLRGNFTKRIQSVAQSMHNTLGLELTSAQKTQEELGQEIDKLATAQSNLKTDADAVEQRFMYAWNSTVSDFEASLGEAQRQAEAALQKELAAASLWNVGKLGKELPTVIARNVETVLAAPSKNLERDLQADARQLGAEFPQISTDLKSQVNVRYRGDVKTLLGGAVVGTASAAAGIGAVTTAGATVAAVTAAQASIAGATLTAQTVIATSVSGQIAAGAAAIQGWLAGLGLASAPVAGTAGVAVALPTLPAWVALAGPIGWSLVGVGALVIPFAYCLSRLKSKHSMEDAALKQVQDIFGVIVKERVPYLKKMGKRMIEEHQLKLNNDIEQTMKALQRARARKTDAKNTDREAGLINELAVLVNPPA